MNNGPHFDKAWHRRLWHIEDKVKLKSMEDALADEMRQRRKREREIMRLMALEAVVASHDTTERAA